MDLNEGGGILYPSQWFQRVDYDNDYEMRSYDSLSLPPFGWIAVKFKRVNYNEWSLPRYSSNLALWDRAIGALGIGLVVWKLWASGRHYSISFLFDPYSFMKLCSEQYRFCIDNQCVFKGTATRLDIQFIRKLKDYLIYDFLMTCPSKQSGKQLPGRLCPLVKSFRERLVISVHWNLMPASISRKFPYYGGTNKWYHLIGKWDRCHTICCRNFQLRIQKIKSQLLWKRQDSSLLPGSAVPRSSH